MKKVVKHTVRVLELVDPQGRANPVDKDIPAGVEAELIKNGWHVRRYTKERTVLVNVCDSCKENVADAPVRDTAPHVYCSECV